MPDPVYREAVSAFYTGLAALQTSQEVLARQKFERVTAIVPDEPAAWANLGLLMVRQQEIDGALQKLGKAADLAPTSGAIQRMLGLAESRRGNLPEAIKHWSRAIELDPGDIKSAFALAQETARQGGAENEAAAMTELQRLLERSDNLAARLELARLAAKRGDAAVFRQVIAPLANLSAGWPPEAQAQLASLQAAAGGDPRAAATRVVFLKNLLLPVLSYRRALAAVTTPNDAVGEPLAGFLALPNPSAQPAAADQALAFAVQPLSGQSPTAANWVGPWSAGGDGAPVAAVAGSDGLSINGHRVEIKTDGKSPAPLRARCHAGGRRGGGSQLRLQNRLGVRNTTRHRAPQAGRRRHVRGRDEGGPAAGGAHERRGIRRVGRGRGSRRRSRRGRRAVVLVLRSSCGTTATGPSRLKRRFPVSRASVASRGPTSTATACRTPHCSIRQARSTCCSICAAARSTSRRFRRASITPSP